MQGQQKCCHLLEKKGAHLMRMQDFQTQQIPHATEPMIMQDFQTHSCWANEYIVFPDTTKTMCYRRATSISCLFISLFTNLLLNGRCRLSHERTLPPCRIYLNIFLVLLFVGRGRTGPYWTRQKFLCKDKLYLAVTFGGSLIISVISRYSLRLQFKKNYGWFISEQREIRSRNAQT